MVSGLLACLVKWGALGVVAILMITGILVPKPYYARLEAENRFLREALELERKARDEAADAGRVTNQLIGTIADLAAKRGHRPAGDGRPAGKTPEITP